jgi:hypothetical protein
VYAFQALEKSGWPEFPAAKYHRRRGAANGFSVRTAYAHAILRTRKELFMSATQTTTDPAAHGERLRERSIHGAEWDRIHGGYFASHAVAEPLTKAIRDC